MEYCLDLLEAMEIFVAVVDTGSLSAAGRRLGVPLPTVSRKVSELEAHLKTRLLTRSTRKLLLTDSGSGYVAACRNILEQVGDAERVASGEHSAPKGDLVVTAPIVLGRQHVLPVITDFLASFPEIDIRLVLSDRNVHLLEDHVDLAVRIGDPPDSSLIASCVGAVRTVVCGSPAFLAHHGVPKSLEELSALPCITFDSLSSTVFWNFTAKGSRSAKAIPIHSRLSVNTAEAAIDAAIAGLGLTRVLSYQVVDAITNGVLQSVLETFEPSATPINLIHVGRDMLPLKLRAFLDFALPRLRNRMRYNV